MLVCRGTTGFFFAARPDRTARPGSIMRPRNTITNAHGATCADEWGHPDVSIIRAAFDLMRGDTGTRIAFYRHLWLEKRKPLHARMRAPDLLLMNPGLTPDEESPAGSPAPGVRTRSYAQPARKPHVPSSTRPSYPAPSRPACVNCSTRQLNIDRCAHEPRGSAQRRCASPTCW